MRNLFQVVLVSAWFCFSSNAATANVTLSTFATGFSSPVDIANAGDNSGRLFVVQQGGLIRVVQNGIVLPTPFLDLSGSITTGAGSEQGLLGLAFHPDYKSNGLFFVYFTSNANATAGAQNGDIIIARFMRSAADPNIADAASRVNVLTIVHAKNGSRNANHNGGSLRFGPDGYLYAGVGDGGGGGDPFASGQDRNVLLGKLLRLDVSTAPGGTYTIPPTNPYFGQSGVRQEIWAYGLRNPWRFSFDSDTGPNKGDLYIGDVGQDAWEEVNKQAAGSAGGINYGWNVCEGSHRYPPTSPVSACVPPANYVAPILEYSHADGFAVVGGYVYRGKSTPDLLGKYVFGDEVTSKLFVNDPPGTVALIPGVSAQVSSFGEGESRELYLAAIGSGVIYSFSSSTDMAPDPIAFDSPTGVPVNTLTTSRLVKITGLGTATSISITNGEYTASTSNSTSCSSSYTPTSGTIATNTYLCVRHTSAGTPGAQQTTILTIGSSTFNFASTTQGAAPTFTVTPSKVGNGFISPGSPQTVTSGQGIQFQISPVPGNTVAVTGTCGGTLSGNNYNTSPITANCTVIATFTPITYAVTPSAGANGSIAPGSVQNINQGATATFTVTPNAGYTASVGGTCGGALSGTTYTTAAITAACTVAATFTSIAVPPGAPVIGSATPGDTTASVSFAAPASNGGAAITRYTATCGATVVDGTHSPILVSGLVNGSTYSCSVTATNSAGTGTASGSASVTPDSAVPLALDAVQSRKTHGSAGPFDLDIDPSPPIAGAISVEPRYGSAGHKLVFQFNVPVSSAAGVVLEDAAAQPVAGATAEAIGKEIIVSLPAIADGTRVKVTVTSVLAVNGSGLASVSASAGFLVGDVNQTRSVNASDISGVKARASGSLTTANFRFDVNLSGAIDDADVLATKARSGILIP